MESGMGVTLNNDKMGNDGASGTNPNKPITPRSPNGIAHSTCDVTGTDGLVTTVKAERAAMKLDWAAWVASWKSNFQGGEADGFKGGTTAAAAYDGTFTSVDGSTAVNVSYEDE